MSLGGALDNLAQKALPSARSLIHLLLTFVHEDEIGPGSWEGTLQGSQVQTTIRGIIADTFLHRGEH